MNERTSVLLGLEDEFAVLQLDRLDEDTIEVVIEVVDREGACPGCGVLSSGVKERPLVRAQGPARLGAAHRAVMAKATAGVPRTALRDGHVHPAVRR